MGKRSRANGTTIKRGAPEHFTGFKQLFLASKATEYQEALDSKTVALFYNKVTLAFIGKYGEDEPFSKELVEDCPDPEDMDVDEGDVDKEDVPRTQEEAAASAVLYTKLRNKLAQWFRRKYKRLEAPKTDSPSVNPFTAILAANIEKAPRRLTALHHYFRLHYKSRVKAEVDRRLTVAKKNYDDYIVAKADYDKAATEDGEDLEEPDVIQKPAAIVVRAVVGKEFWELETPEFRAAVELDAEETHDREMAEWEETKQVPQTPQQFHQQLAFAGQILRPVADAIAFQMQAAVSICIIGPVADRNGGVEVRSIHVNWPGGLANATWPQHDPIGYSEAEKSMCAYGRANFSTAECRRRALPVQIQGNSEDGTMNGDAAHPIITNNSGESVGGVPDVRNGVRRSPSIPRPLLNVAPPNPLGRSPNASPVPPNLESLLRMPNNPEDVTNREESPFPRQWRRAIPSPSPEPESIHDNPDGSTHRESPPLSKSPGPTPEPDPNQAQMPAPQLPDNDNSERPIPPSSPLAAPLPPTTSRSSDWPAHMVDAHKYLTEETITTDGVSVMIARSWGNEWLACVCEFVEFQRRARFPDVGPSFPPAAGVRPPEIAIWMKNRRPWKDVEIKDTQVFRQQWQKWWLSLQPSTRILDDDGEVGEQSSPTTKMDWSNVNKPGKNGLLLVMVSLAWWRKALDTNGEWLKAVGDVTEVLRCVRSIATSSSNVGGIDGKRAREVQDGSVKKRSRH